MKRITAKTIELNLEKIEQCDVFRDITLVEGVYVDGTTLSLSEMSFPMAMCINQSCDLESDLRQHKSSAEDLLQDGSLFQLIMIPVFVAEKFRDGRHWGELRRSLHINREKWCPIEKNEDPRFHVLTFPDDKSNTIPQLVLDFKHFFTVGRDYLYSHKENRLFSIAPLYRERISQRFANYFSRIGLPEEDLKSSV